jgi:DnaJ-class molecular chaperone
MGDAADDLEFQQEGWYDDGDEGQGSECPTCKGTGLVGPLTAPKDFFCLAQTDCPTCDGDGDI